jgi:hypothetical protein
MIFCFSSIFPQLYLTWFFFGLLGIENNNMQFSKLPLSPPPLAPTQLILGGKGEGGGWGVGGDSCLVGSMSISPHLFAQLAIVYCKIILLRQ